MKSDIYVTDTAFFKEILKEALHEMFFVYERGMEPGEYDLDTLDERTKFAALTKYLDEVEIFVSGTAPNDWRNYVTKYMPDGSNWKDLDWPSKVMAFVLSEREADKEYWD